MSAELIDPSVLVYLFDDLFDETDPGKRRSRALWFTRASCPRL